MARFVSSVFVLWLLVSNAHAWPVRGSGSPPPTPAVRCVLSGTVNGVNAGDCTGVGGGTGLFTAATCNGSGDDRVAMLSFNTWATNTWQASHTGLIELDIQAGKDCNMLGGSVNSNGFTFGIKSFQLVGYGATIGNGVGGAGFFLGSVVSALTFDNTHSARISTVSAGASSITLLNTALCSLFNNGDDTLIAGIDPQGFGDPPNPQRFEWVTIVSTASCAGSGVITLSAPLAYAYKSTWPVYNSGNSGQSDLGGPGTLYALDQRWRATQTYYGVTIDQDGFNSNSAGRDITFRDVTWTNTSCNIPSQNLNWRIYNGTGTGCTLEFDKIVSNIVMDRVALRRVLIQQPAITTWTCNACTIAPIGVTGSVAATTVTNSTIQGWILGSNSYAAAGSFYASNTVFTDGFSIGGSSSDGTGPLETVGVWSSTGLTIPPNMTGVSAANNGSGEIRLQVTSTAGWTNGIVTAPPNGLAGDCYVGASYPVVVVDATHIDFTGSTFLNTCSGPLGNLPATWAVPGANVQFSGNTGVSPSGPLLQIDDIAVGANNATVITFTSGGVAWTGGLPTMFAAPPSRVFTHPAPLFECVNCSGHISATDVNNVPAGPYGSYVRRVVTTANSGASPSAPTFGQLIDTSITVTAACSGASNLDASQFVTTINSAATSRTFTATVNANIASATPRVVTTTGATGAQSGDTLTPPGVGTLTSYSQFLPTYSNPSNCASASATVVQRTNQGVVYP